METEFRGIRIILNNNKSRLVGEKKVIEWLKDETKMKHPNAFWSPAKRSGRWDGYVRYITDSTDMFPTGMLPQILELLKEKKILVKITEQRNNLIAYELPKKVGSLTLRDYQLESSISALRNEIYGLSFQRGILYEATNAGKNLIAAAIVKAFRNREALFLINNTEIFVQAIDELEKLLPGKIGEVSSKVFKWNQLTICMVQTLKNRIKIPKVNNMVQRVPIVIVDEADEVINRKDTRDIFNLLYNAPVRIALTGTALKNKNKINNQYLINFFGPVLHRTSNKQLVDWGHSAKPKINFVFGMQTKKYGDYQSEYIHNVIRNPKRNKKIWRITQKQIDKKRGPVVIIVRYHEHIKRLFNSCPESMRDNLAIKRIHGKLDMSIRKRIIEDFRKNKVDVLITSMILRRGKNIKNMNSLIVGSGGDSEAGTLQIFGRALRLNERHNRVWIYEFFDYGKYLQRHSKHRIKFYKKEGFEVNENYKALMNKMHNPDL